MKRDIEDTVACKSEEKAPPIASKRNTARQTTLSFAPSPSPSIASEAATTTAAAKKDGETKTRTCEVISCSRRSDVPAFFMPWVMGAISAGVVAVKNPHSGKSSLVSLDPAIVRCIAWWSKDYAPWIEQWKSEVASETTPLVSVVGSGDGNGGIVKGETAAREKVRGLRSYDAHMFNFTVNCASGGRLEKGVRHSLEERLDQMAWLASTFTPRSVVLRFDPIVHYRVVGDPKELDNLSDFERIAERASAAGITEIATAFIIPFPRVKARMRRLGIEISELSLARKLEIVAKLTEVASRFGVGLRACCQPELKLPATCCIDGTRINELLRGSGKRTLGSSSLKKDSGQRGTCKCTKSADIGGYGNDFKCPHGCSYCYANPSN